MKNLNHSNHNIAINKLNGFACGEIGSLWSFKIEATHYFLKGLIAYSKLVSPAKRINFYDGAGEIPCRILGVNHKKIIMKLSDAAGKNSARPCYKALFLDHDGNPRIGWVDDLDLLRHLRRVE